MPHDEVATRYGTTRSRVKDLQESAGKFALMVAAFCECLGWSDLDILISKFQVSLECCCCPPPACYNSNNKSINKHNNNDNK